MTKKILEERILLEIRENAPYVTSLKNFIKEGEKLKITPELRLELSTLRNRNLITREQQEMLSNTVVGFFGLSVGSHAAVTWVMESRAHNVKISDPDTIDPTNLNRYRTGWGSVGHKKTDIVSDEIRSINPDIDIVACTEVEELAVLKLFDDKPKIDIVVDEVDSISAKLLLRRLARERKLPLISAADVGDNVVLDVERYDIEPQPELFLGRVPGIEGMDFNKLNNQEKAKLIIQLVGADNFTDAMTKSLQGVGKTLKTWPQLGATATIAGGAIATTIKKIVLGEKVRSGRYVISLDNIFASATA